jgi:hypothetical protein
MLTPAAAAACRLATMSALKLCLRSSSSPRLASGAAFYADQPLVRLKRETRVQFLCRSLLPAVLRVVMQNFPAEFTAKDKLAVSFLSRGSREAMTDSYNWTNLSCPTLEDAPAEFLAMLALRSREPLKSITIWSGTAWPLCDVVPRSSWVLKVLRNAARNAEEVILAGDWGFANLAVLFRMWSGLPAFRKVRLLHLSLFFVSMRHAEPDLFKEREWTPLALFDEMVPRGFPGFLYRFSSFVETTWDIKLSTVVVCPRTIAFFVGAADKIKLHRLIYHGISRSLDLSSPKVARFIEVVGENIGLESLELADFPENDSSDSESDSDYDASPYAYNVELHDMSEHLALIPQQGNTISTICFSAFRFEAISDQNLFRLWGLTPENYPALTTMQYSTLTFSLLDRPLLETLGVTSTQVKNLHIWSFTCGTDCLDTTDPTMPAFVACAFGDFFEHLEVLSFSHIEQDDKRNREAGPGVELDFFFPAVAKLMCEAPRLKHVDLVNCQLRTGDWAALEGWAAAGEGRLLTSVGLGRID